MGELINHKFHHEMRDAFRIFQGCRDYRGGCKKQQQLIGFWDPISRSPVLKAFFTWNESEFEL